MENTPENSEERAVSRSTTSRGWINAAVATLPVFACFLGGATEKWSEGIIIALLGVGMLADPPRLSLGRTINGILLALLGLALMAFLPASWFTEPEWRTALVNDFGIRLPSTVSPQPWVTLGCVLSFIAGLSWLYQVSAREWDARAVRTQLRLFAAGIGALALLCLALRFAHTTLPFWHNERRFGPFPNRNQTANVFALAAVITFACGYDDIRNRRLRWVVWLGTAAAIIAAIFLGFSRAGIVLLIAGATLWMGAVALRKASPARIALGMSALLVLLTALLLFGGQTFERFHLRSADAGGMSSEFRWLIFQDALDLIRHAPWCGLGLGNFEPVFAIFRNASIGDTRAHHPESDWLWLLSEMGWPALVLAVCGTLIFLSRTFPLRGDKHDRFRLAAFIAACLFALHGLLDVGGHRVGSAFSAIFLLGLALRRPMELRPSRVCPILFRIVGVVLLLTGATWVAATRWELRLPGSLGAENAKHLAMMANQGRNFPETISRTTRAIEWTPLDWQLYFARALGEYGAKQPVNALADFRRARFLEPNSVSVPLEEGKVWLTTQPLLAFTAWREALRRAGPRRAEVYGQMLTLASQFNPAVNRSLEEFGATEHDLALAYLEHVSGDRFNVALTGLLKHDPDLTSLTGAEKTKLFVLWAQRGDVGRLAQLTHSHADWSRYAWRGVAKYRAAQKDYRGAFDLARRFGGTPALPQPSQRASLENLQTEFAANPNNYASGYALYRLQIEQGKTDDALASARHFTRRADCPPYFHFLEAEAWAAKQHWERAWTAREAFDAATAPAR